MGGLIVRFTLNLKIWALFKFSLYLPIIWLFWMGSHWPHWKAKSSLWALAVSNGGVNHQIYPKSENLSSFQVFLISSYYLTVSNGCSLVPLKSVELTQCSGSFKWGGHQIYPKSENLSSLSLYFLIIWLFQMDAHWQHWKAESSLSALAVSNGGVHQIYPKSENLSSLAISCFASQKVFSYYIRKT